MADERPLVRNTADPKQVANAARKESDERDRQLADLRAVLDTEAGRRFVWRVLGYCNLFADGFNESAQLTAFNAGVKNVGAFLLAEITEASDESFFQMMRESKARDQARRIEAEALRTKRATEGADEP